MNLTIIAEDKIVIVDGEPHVFDFVIDPEIHAVQWSGAAGVIEYKDPARENETIESLAAYQSIINARNADVAAKQQAKEDAQQAAYDALPPIEKARREFPSIEEHVEALHEARQGNTTALDAIDAAILAAKLKHGA